MADRRATFVTNYLPYAQQASALTGIDPAVILAQAAHETAWGRRAPGNNFFGIKGGGQTFATHEYVNGKRVNMRAGFRRYDDPLGSFLDWAKLMQTPRYAGVLAAKTPEEQIRALKAAGYATDPAYVSKLLNVRGQVTKMAGAVGATAPTNPVTGLQKYLAQNGFDPGPIDGVMGPKTLTALNAYNASADPQGAAAAQAALAQSGVTNPTPQQMADAFKEASTARQTAMAMGQTPAAVPAQTPPPQTPQMAYADAVDRMDMEAPAQQAVAEMAAGTGADTLMGGISPPTPRLRDQSVLNQNMADQLDAAMFGEGPHRGDYARGRPEGRWVEGAGGAPDASAVPTPVSRRASGVTPPPPQVAAMPNPPQRPGGAPDAGSVPMPPPRAQGIPNPPSNPRRDPFGFPIDVNRPRINNPDGSFSTERTTTFDAAEVGLPPEIVTVPTIVNGRQVSEDEARALFASGQNPPVQRGFDSFEAADRAAEARTGSIAAARATNGERGFPQFYGEQPGPQPTATAYADAIDRFDTEAAAPQPQSFSPPPTPEVTDSFKQSFDLANDLNTTRENTDWWTGDLRPQASPAPAQQYEIGNLNYSDTPSGRMPQTQAAVSVAGNGAGPYGSGIPAAAQFDQGRMDDGLKAPISLPETYAQLLDTPDGMNDAAFGRSYYAGLLPLQREVIAGASPDRLSLDAMPGSDTARFFNANQPSTVDRVMSMIDPSLEPQSGAMTGGGAPAGTPWSQPGSGQWMTDGRPPALPALPTTSQMTRDQFNVSFSPGGPGMIADLSGPKPSPTQSSSNPFEALLGPAAAMGALPFTEETTAATSQPSPVAQNVMADALDMADSGGQPLIGSYGVMGATPPRIDINAYHPDAMVLNQPGALIADRPVGTGGETVPITQQAAPMATGGGAAPITVQAPQLGGGRLNGTSGGLFGMGANWAGPQWTGPVSSGSSPYGEDQVTQWWSGPTNAMGGTNALSWTGSNGRTITAYDNSSSGWPQQGYTMGYGPQV